MSNDRSKRPIDATVTGRRKFITDCAVVAALLPERQGIADAVWSTDQTVGRFGQAS